MKHNPTCDEVRLNAIDVLVDDGEQAFKVLGT